MFSKQITRLHHDLTQIYHIQEFDKSGAYAEILEGVAKIIPIHNILTTSIILIEFIIMPIHTISSAIEIELIGSKTKLGLEGTP